MSILKKIMDKMSSTISVEEAKELLQNGAVLLDVRTVAEFEQSHAKMAINIPLDSLDAKIKDLPNHAIIVHCQSGMRSKMAMSKIINSGRKDVYNLGSVSKALQI